MATKKPATKPAEKPAAKKDAAKKPAKADYPKDDGAVSKKTVQKVQETALKPKKPAKVKTGLFEVKPEEPGVHVGNYSVRTVDHDGKVNLDIDWDKLREHMKTV
jgi:hypothetical protein